MGSPNPPSARGLIRPPLSLSPAPPPARAPSPESPRSLDGIIVVGFISRRPDDSSQLINRVVDSNIFGSGHLDKILAVDDDGVKDWFRFRKVSYYLEEEKGILYLQFCSTGCPAFDGLSDPGSGFESVVEDREFSDLQGMLFMFSVCHVIIYIHEGSRFDTQLLKKLRVLQAAKQALAPYVRSNITPSLSSKPHSSASSPFLRPPVTTSPSNNASQARNGVILNRNASSVMPGVGSHTFFPGQCTPVILFVFIDDFSDMPSSIPSVDEATKASTHNQSLSTSGLVRPSLPLKGSGSVVILDRPATRSEGGLKKKLESSLEAQIRFLIKKCRTLVTSENNHAASRSGGLSSSAPLLSLDASKIVVLLDRHANQKGEALDFTTDLIEDVLGGKAKLDSLLLDVNSHISDQEDILSIKEFIHRQSDVIRGKGGMINANNSGVGIVAVAAAVAAASASSGRTFTAPNLPNLDVWLSYSKLLLLGLLTAKGGLVDEIDTTRRKPRQRNISPVQVEGVPSKTDYPLNIAISWLQSGKGLNTKFSTAWCEQALPAAKDVYLKDLPACYPTPVHEVHIQKALLAFNSMVRGPSVEAFRKRLVDECTSIWECGRQLCDAVSLTGKPCMHQRHDVGTGEPVSVLEVKQHSSGYVFLHACACGRSRKLRSDPFDFKSANITFNCFGDCDKLLSTAKLPEVSSLGPIKSSSWSLLRIGGARYYEPSKGLLQSGFCATQKFLLKWKICLEKQNISSSDFSPDAVREDSTVKSSVDPKVISTRTADIGNIGSKQFKSRAVINEKTLDGGKIGENDNKVNFGKGLLTFTMKKPFSEVVAGSTSLDSSFPPLQQRKQASPAPEKIVKHIHQNGQMAEKILNPSNKEFQSQNPESVPSHQGSANGSSAVDVNKDCNKKVESNLMQKYVTAYIGLEHECPRGHRFLLSSEHVDQLGAPFLMPEASHLPHPRETSNVNNDASKFEKNLGYGKGRRRSNRMATAVNKMKNMDRPRQIIAKGILNAEGPGKEHYQTRVASGTLQQLTDDIGTHLQPVNLGDDSQAFSMLKRNLPLYLKCPHCLASKKDVSKIKHAGTISQLQRIFLVTPSFPIVLATCPVIQFQESCLPPSVTDREQKLQFNLGSPVILPPDSFLTLRLPFVYGVQLEDKTQFPLNPFEHEPENTAWIVKGTAIQIISKESSLNEKLPT